ncbi:hypothetical protein [Paenibacillus sp. Y412MC10]|uniref:hypothetical protein n=1 Tax=Geobacillus sp. (strain Y412MC10) TaxID=481743 RepID=UPI0011AB7502|nr:hypothetical protein [Paenibacillus sp. Y412MC10]
MSFGVNSVVVHPIVADGRVVRYADMNDVHETHEQESIIAFEEGRYIFEQTTLDVYGPVLSLIIFREFMELMELVSQAEETQIQSAVNSKEGNFVPAKVLTWRYNKDGHVEIWNGSIIPDQAAESDLYLQQDTDVKSFFNAFGMKLNDISIGDWKVQQDTIGYLGLLEAQQ